MYERNSGVLRARSQTAFHGYRGFMDAERKQREQRGQGSREERPWGALVLAGARLAAEVAAEVLWPTRCALCDAPGSVLCADCERALPRLDWWRACRRCGSPFGLMQCDLCNQTALARLGREKLPFAACASAVMFDEGTSGRIVRVFKDQGEQRLSAAMAALMANALPPSWEFDAVTFVPATLAAVRSRGFDHAQLVAVEVSSLLDAPCVEALARPKTRDQRALSGRQRIKNLAGRFRCEGTCPQSRLLLVDDVFTTGATLCAATDALLAAGCQEVRCLTFARV